MSQNEVIIDNFKPCEKSLRNLEHVCKSDRIISFERYESDNNNYRIVKNVELWNEKKTIYSIPGHEGLYVISNALPLWLQLELAHFSLLNCTKSPNKTNLTKNVKHFNFTFHITSLQIDNIWERESATFDNFLSADICEISKKSDLGNLRWTTIGMINTS